VHVSVHFGHEGGQYIQNAQRCPKVNILQLTVPYLNAMINSETQNAELEIATDESSQTKLQPMVDGYGSAFGPPSGSGLGL